MLASLLGQLAELTFTILEQCLRTVVFQHFAFVKDQYHITLNDCLNSVGNCYHSALFEFLLYHFLDLLLRQNVDICSCFIQYDDFVFP